MSNLHSCKHPKLKIKTELDKRPSLNYALSMSQKTLRRVRYTIGEYRRRTDNRHLFIEEY